MLDHNFYRYFTLYPVFDLLTKKNFDEILKSMIVEKKTASNTLHWAIFDLKMGAQSGGHPGTENRPDHHSSLQKWAETDQGLASVVS